MDEQKIIIRLARDNHFTRRYVCACCWGDLGVEFKHENSGEYFCLKGPENCSGRGFVTRRYAEKRLVENLGELAEVKRNYPDLAGKKVKQSAAAILAELGF